MIDGELRALHAAIDSAYSKACDILPFHNLAHVKFVVRNALLFNEEVQADRLDVEVSCLVHDLNYLVDRKSDPEVGAVLRYQILSECGFRISYIDKIERIVIESHTAYRNRDISEPGKCLSDADTLFKALPITPIIFANKFIQQCNSSVKKLALKIVCEQKPLMRDGIYFYTNMARSKYQRWADTNLALWENVLELIDDHPDLISDIMSPSIT